jgi:hypothetical protein
VAAGEAVSAGLVAVAASGEAVAAGAAVSVFCSQAASSAAPAKMQMYFFIVLNWEVNIELMNESEQATFSVLTIMAS